MYAVQHHNRKYKICESKRSFTYIHDVLFNAHPVLSGTVQFQYTQRNILGFRVLYFFAPITTALTVDGTTFLMKSAQLASKARHNEFMVGSGIDSDTINAFETTDVIAFHNMDMNNTAYAESGGPSSFEPENKDIIFFNQPYDLKYFDWRIESAHVAISVPDMFGGSGVKFQIEFFYACECE